MLASNNKVSICIPTYNGGKFIARALHSVLNQTHSDVEVIITDDGSEDNTKSIVTSYANQDSRVKFFENEKSLSVIPNYFQALRHSSGEYVQFLGQDDWLSKNYIATARKYFDGSSNIGAVFTKTVGFILEEDKLKFQHEVYFGGGYYSTKYFAQRVFKTAWGSLSFGALWRRNDAIRAADSILKICEDSDYGALYARGFATDWAFALSVLENYEQLYFCEEAAYIKLGHDFNAGKSFGFRNDRAIDILKSREVIIRCLAPVYREKFAGLFSKVKIEIVSLALVELILNFIKARLNSGFFGGFKVMAYRNLFKELNILQKTLAIVLIPLWIILRGIQFIFRSGQTVKPVSSDRYFVNLDGKFTK